LAEDLVLACARTEQNQILSQPSNTTREIRRSAPERGPMT